jgi:hypothetical protein
MLQVEITQALLMEKEQETQQAALAAAERESAMLKRQLAEARSTGPTRKPPRGSSAKGSADAEEQLRLKQAEVDKLNKRMASSETEMKRVKRAHKKEKDDMELRRQREQELLATAAEEIKTLRERVVEKERAADKLKSQLAKKKKHVHGLEDKLAILETEVQIAEEKREESMYQSAEEVQRARQEKREAIQEQEKRKLRGAAMHQKRRFQRNHLRAWQDIYRTEQLIERRNARRGEKREADAFKEWRRHSLAVSAPPPDRRYQTVLY